MADDAIGEMHAAVERQRFRNRLAIMTAAVALVFAVGFTIVSILFIVRFTSTVDRQNCIAREINAPFFGHLSDALGQEPGSVSRTDFSNEMKADAARFKHLDDICGG